MQPGQGPGEVERLENNKGDALPWALVLMKMDERRWFS